MHLEMDKISKAIGNIQILHHVTLSAPCCKSLVLIGPSGSGKSTLMRMIAGLTTPDSGTISLNHKQIPLDEKGLLAHRRSIGTVFQSWNLFPHLTALENISLPLYRVHGYSAQEAKSQAMELLQRFELQRHADKKPAELSGGQSQRVAIIRAVAIRPKLLLFDEPTSALDPIMTSEVLDLIVELKVQGIDFVLVSHHMSFARKITDCVAFLQEGTIVEAGPTESFFSQPKTAEAKAFLSRVLKY